jgi:phospholipase/carboxylesterase
VFIAHGRRDPIMDVAFARRAHELLDAAGLPVSYHESEAAHHIDPSHIPAVIPWLAATTDGCRATAAITPTPKGR